MDERGGVGIVRRGEKENVRVPDKVLPVGIIRGHDILKVTGNRQAEFPRQGQEFTMGAPEYCAEIARAADRLQALTGQNPERLNEAVARTSPF